MERTKNIIIVGDGYVGKTSILNAIKKNKFEEHIPNVYDNFECLESTNGTEYRFNFIDTAGQEEYDMMRKLLYRDAHMFLLCFAIDDKVSFENLGTKWIPNLEEYRNIPLLLIGTKSDLRNSDAFVSREEAVRYQKKIGAVHYVECSAKSHGGIEELKKKTFKLLLTNSRERSCIIQ